ncbi:carbohydrate ABC transporter permease [Paenibacillaceae bacterium WGS1546]|uniref:carbohydrate ABC transporter permease n=1 Tax=Cohnella sp. WGS1546 TaxID=3366810 RepID=UPI00372D2ED1
MANQLQSAQAAAAPREKRRRRGTLALKAAIEGYGMVAPALIMLGVFIIYPIFYGLYISFHRWDGFSDMSFVGWLNYRNLFMQDGVFRQAAGNTLLYAFAITIGKNVIGLALALLVHQKIRGLLFFRTALFVPVTLSYVVVGLLWTWIYNPSFGLLASGLKAIGLESWVIPWLGGQHTALWAVIAVEIWKWAGFHMVLFLGGLQGIPSDLYEAAIMDGASARRRFIHITLPLLKPIAFISVFLALNGGFVRNFDLVYIMTGGGPNHATEVVLTHMVSEAFQRSNLGYASAMGYTLFATVAILIVTYARLFNRGKGGG